MNIGVMPQMARVQDPVTIAQDFAAGNDTGDGSSSHTWTSRSMTGPLVVLVFGWADTSGPSVYTISNVDVNGDTATIIASIGEGGSPGDNPGVCMAYVENSYSSITITATFTGSVDDSYLVCYSLDGYVAAAPIDSDSSDGTGTSASLSALTLPSSRGVTIAGCCQDGSGDNITWTNLTEDVEVVVDSASGFGVAYESGLLGGAPDADWTNSNEYVLIGAAWE